MTIEKSSKINLITGIPRSGTTLCCNLLNRCTNTLALHEPIDPQRLRAAEPITAVQEVRDQIYSIRNSLKESRPIEHGSQAGIKLDNPIGLEKNEKGLRRQHVKRGTVVLPTINASTTLFIKQNALFAAFAGELSKHFKMIAVIRNPVDVLLSWMTVDLPVNRGRLPGGERYDKDLALQLTEGTVFERQLKIYEWFVDKFQRAELKIVRYEDIIKTDGKDLYSVFNINEQTPLSIPERSFPETLLKRMTKNWPAIARIASLSGYNEELLQDRLTYLLNDSGYSHNEKASIEKTSHLFSSGRSNSKRKRIGIDDKGAHNNFGGYGQLSREMIKALCKNYDVKIIGLPIGNTFDEDLYLEVDVEDYDEYFDIVYHISSPKKFALNKRCKNIIYTQNALGDLKPDWVQKLKEFDHIIVPGEFDRKVFNNYFGSVSKCPQLIDNTTFKPVPRWRAENSEQFTFLFVGTIHYRKGFDLLIKSLSSAADQLQQKIKLICLVESSNIITYLNFFTELNAQRSKFLDIEYIVKSLTPPWMNRYYNRSDAFITLSRGEGWCMPAHEATLAELPVIVPFSTAFKEYLSFLPSVLSVNINELNFDNIERTSYNKSLLEGYYTPNNLIYECSIEDATTRICELITNYPTYKNAAKESAQKIKETYNQSTFLKRFDNCLQQLKPK